MPPGFGGTRPPPNVAVKAARRGWALFRAVLLLIATAVLIAVVLAAVFGGLVIAIDGKLP